MRDISRFRVLKQSLASWPGRGGGIPPAWPATLCLVWLAGAGAVLAQVGTGIAQVRRLGRRCPRVTEGPLVALLRALNREVGQQRPVILRMAGPDQPAVVPMTWGWRRPVVLLPADAARWPEARLRSVLLHELAHVRRGDWPAQLLTYATCALYWFHPLVWLAARQMRLESERACDDRVLAAGVHAPEYASHLLEIVRSLRGPRRPLRAALTAAPQSPIERRLRSILEERRSRRAAPRWAVPLALAIAAATVIPLAGIRPLDEPAPGSGPQIAAAGGQRAPGRAIASPGSLVAILETTGHSTTVAHVSIRREDSPRAAGRTRRTPLRPAPRRLQAGPIIPGLQRLARTGIRTLARLQPAASVLPVKAPARQLASLPTGAPSPSPQPAPRPAAAQENGMTDAIPADYVRDDSEDGDGTPPAVTAAFVDEHADANAGDPPAPDAEHVKLAAAVNPEEIEMVPATSDLEQDTAVLPAAGQDAEVLPAAEKGAEPGDDSCLRWAALREAAERAAAQQRFIIQPVLVWNPDAREWVRLLLVWDRVPDGNPGTGDRDTAPEPALALPESDPEGDLTEPAVIAQKLPEWEQRFDRWEKAFAERRRQQIACTPGSAL